MRHKTCQDGVGALLVSLTPHDVSMDALVTQQLLKFETQTMADDPRVHGSAITQWESTRSQVSRYSKHFACRSNVVTCWNCVYTL